MAKLRKIKRCKKPSHAVRISKELREIITYIRYKYVLHGKKPPSISNITKSIAKKINKEKLLEDEFIRI